MKKSEMFIAFGITLFLLINTIVAAQTCNIDASLINQDPYPAIPGDYVKIVFQLTGVQDASCNGAKFQVIQNYPFTLDSSDTTRTLEASTWANSYNNYWNIPYNVRIDNDAIDGDSEIEVLYSSPGSSSEYTKKFNITIKDSRSNFEVFVKNYNPLTKIITFEILNTGKNDVKALTMEIPAQAHIQVKGPSRNIVGDLDSNEYSTADFEIASGAGNIEVNLFYTDSIQVRRNLTTTVVFEPLNFQGRAADKKSSSGTYVIVGIIVIIILVILYRRYKRKSKQR